MFPFEKLDVYQKSLSLVEKIDTLNSALRGKVSYPVCDQLTRAVISIPSNVAEGVGQLNKKERARFYCAARSSLFEMVPLLKVIHMKDHLTDFQHTLLYNDLETLAKMLTDLIKSVENLK